MGPQHGFGHNHIDSRQQLLNQQHGTVTQPYSGSNSDNQLKRSASQSPRSTTSPGQSQDAITNGSLSRGSSGNQSDSIVTDHFSADDGNVIGSAASVNSRTDSMTGNYGKGRDQSGSRWSHVGPEASVSGYISDEPSSRYSGTAGGGSWLSGGKNGDDGGELQGSNRRVHGSGAQERSIQKNVQPSGDGVQSLPSLKASGLLDSWGSPWKTGLIEVHPNDVGGLQRPLNQVSSASPRRTTPPVANLSMLTVSSVSQGVSSKPHSEVNDLRATSTLKAVPVGLPWLAKEPR